MNQRFGASATKYRPQHDLVVFTPTVHNIIQASGIVVVTDDRILINTEFRRGKTDRREKSKVRRLEVSRRFLLLAIAVANLAMQLDSGYHEYEGYSFGREDWERCHAGVGQTVVCPLCWQQCPDRYHPGGLHERD